MDQAQQAALQEAMDSLLDDSPLDKVVATAASVGLDGVDVPIRISLLYLKFKEDIPQEDALARFLWQQCFAYALPRRRRIAFQKKMQENVADVSVAAEITDRVRSIFLTFRAAHPHRASELGEVLAYCITVRHLKAAQMAAKMSLKTSSNMPVHGLDGIHATFENDALTIYFLESKLTKTAAAGIRDYTDSVSTFLKNEKQYLREYELVGDLGNLDSLEGEARELALRHFDIINEPHLSRRERSVGIICYSENSIFSKNIPIDERSPNIHEQYFADLYSKKIKNLSKKTVEHLESRGANPKKCIVFFVAVPNVDRLREKFYGVMGLPPLDDIAQDVITDDNDNEEGDDD